MKSGTSFFNRTVLKKDITRFAPLWGLYTVFMLFYLFLWQSEQTNVQMAMESQFVLQSMGVVNFCYAGLSALLLFADLFKSRLCNALHAMPLRREGWFLTHLTAGMLFCIVPNGIGALVAAVLLQQYWYLALLWLAVMVLQFLFFFAVGAFSAQCSGSLLGAAAVYAIFNFLSALVVWLGSSFYEPVLHGIIFRWEEAAVCSPVIGFSGHTYIDIYWDRENFFYSQANAVFGGLAWVQWRYLFIAAGVGVVLLMLSVLMYRRRRLESAGDFIAFRPAAPVFLVLYALCVGAVFHVIADSLSGDPLYLLLLVGMTIGFFTGHMLLDKKVQVFTPKKLLGLAVLVLVFFTSVALVWLDPVGVTRYVPQTEQIQQVTVSPYTSDYYFDNKSPTLTEGKDIETVRQIHQRMIQHREETQQSMVFRVCYQLKDGRTVERQYALNPDSSDGQKLKQIYSAASCVLGTEDLTGLAQRITYTDFYSYVENDFIRIPAGETENLLSAIAADCKAGDMAQIWEYHDNDESYAALDIHLDRDGEVLSIVVHSSCTNTVEYLKGLEQKP